MGTYGFTDDYSEGCHPQILEALAAANHDQQAAYGDDQYSVEARQHIAAACGIANVPVFFVSSGTQANLVIIAACLRPHEAVISADSGHIANHEAGAIEATGHKIISVASTQGKLTPDVISDAIAANARFPHMAKPSLVYISNSTEIGTVYSAEELEVLRNTCDEHGLLLLLDGARLGVALESPAVPGLTLETVAAAADVFWIGGTKAGTLLGEAVVIPNASIATDFAFALKQRGALLAKGRVLGLQFLTLFREGLLSSGARHANQRAIEISNGIVSAGYVLAAETQSNQVFAELPNALIEQLHERFSFYVWREASEDTSIVRLVTSWATEPSKVEEFVTALGSAG